MRYKKIEEKYYNLLRLTSNNEEMLMYKKCICIYCRIDSVLPKEYDNYVVNQEDLDILNEMYF